VRVSVQFRYKTDTWCAGNIIPYTGVSSAILLDNFPQRAPSVTFNYLHE